jgi:molybdenum cofactor cytidylyltransferase
LRPRITVQNHVTINLFARRTQKLSDALHTQPAQSPLLKIGAVLLAAGAGSRLGGRPKSLLELDGTPLIRRISITLSDAGIDAVVVVLGHHADAIERAVQDLPVRLMRNPSPDDGPASSLRIGLRALKPDVDAVIVLLADQPLITATDITDLVEPFKSRGDRQMVVPRVDGEPGNPVIIDAALREEWLAGDVNATGQRWRNANPTRVHWFDTSNHHYAIDIDTPEDLVRFAARTGLALRWPEERLTP